MEVRGGIGNLGKGMISFPASGVSFIQEAPDIGCIVQLSNGAQILSTDDYGAACDRWREELKPTARGQDMPAPPPPRPSPPVDEDFL